MIEADGKGLSEKARRAIEIFEGIRAKEVEMARYFLEVIKARTPVGKSIWGERVVKTGDTQKSWTIHIFKNDITGVIWGISPDGKEDIMTFLEFGTKPHIIRPKDPAGVLVFETDDGTIFAKIVHHPGTKPLGIVRLTQKEVDLEAKELLEKLHSSLRVLSAGA
jgi:hypothetical protein